MSPIFFHDLLSLIGAFYRVASSAATRNDMGASRRILEEEIEEEVEQGRIPVADWWAGAEGRVFVLSQLDHLYGPTNRQTD